MSKAFAMFCQGLIMVGDGLKGIAAELQEAGNVNPFLVPDKQETKKEEPKKEAAKVETPKQETKKEETKTEVKIDADKLRTECTDIVKKIAKANKLPEAAAAIKKVGATKVSDCPAEKLVELKAALEAVEV